MFESPYIKISSLGIDLIKNYQVNTHVDFTEVTEVDLIEGHLIKHWLVLLLVGLTIIVFCCAWGINSAITFVWSQDVLVPRAYIAFHFFFPWLLFIGGCVFSYQALRKSPIIIIKTKINKYRVSLLEFKKDNSLRYLIEFLEDRVKVYNNY
ncbi:MAG: hypothetical protein KDC79_06850 [Cyclobacteriaceae bacterium]|nr:hypothetical protein [Cyclobacteriaceae bacterium]